MRAFITLSVEVGALDGMEAAYEFAVKLVQHIKELDGESNGGIIDDAWVGEVEEDTR